MLQDQGCPQDAEACFRRAIELQPAYARGHYNLGNVLRQQERLAEAAVSLRQALRLQPKYLEALNSLGVVLHEQQQYREAASLLEQAIALRPEYAPAHLNLGNVLVCLECFDRAEQHYRQALALRPHYASALLNLGLLLRERGQSENAERCFRQAIDVDPANAEAHQALGELYSKLARSGHAVEEFRQVLQLEPTFTQALANLERDRAELCDWTGREEARQRLIADTKTALAQDKSSPWSPSQCQALAGPAALQLAIARSHCLRLQAQATAVDQGTGQRDGYGRRRQTRLKIGYFSCDFRNHATSHLMQSVFRRHERSAHEIFAYSYGPDDQSSYRRRIAEDCDHFIDIRNCGAHQSAQRIRADGIDILVDLVGLAGNNRLQTLAYRPAPVQVHYLGFPGTLGADFVDYFITDAVVTPPESESHFHEQLVIMPDSYQVNDRQPIGAGRSREDYGLPAESIVFCSFNRVYKIDPVVFDIWMRILEAVPHSVLWLYASLEKARENLRREAQRRGVAAERLVFAGPVAKSAHLARLGHADLFLDTFICNAHTTASDALWAGVPVLTCPGETFATRVAASLLHAVGLPELVCQDAGEYERGIVGQPPSFAR